MKAKKLQIGLNGTKMGTIVLHISDKVYKVVFVFKFLESNEIQMFENGLGARVFQFPMVKWLQMGLL